jgi:hypothetical protein
MRTVVRTARAAAFFTASGREVAAHSPRQKGQGGVQAAVLAQEAQEQCLGHVHAVGGQPTGRTVQVDEVAESGTGVAVERLAWARAENRVTSPFGQSSDLSG